MSDPGLRGGRDGAGSSIGQNARVSLSRHDASTRRFRPPTGSFRYRRPIDVRFADTDAMGHVNNAVYLTYMELARAGYYREVTGSTFGIGAQTHDRSFILADARVTYASPVLFGEHLVCECRVGWTSRSSFSMDYRLSVEEPSGQVRLAAYGETIQVMYDYAAGRVMPLPADLLAILEAYESDGRTVEEAAPVSAAD